MILFLLLVLGQEAAVAPPLPSGPKIVEIRNKPKKPFLGLEKAFDTTAVVQLPTEITGEIGEWKAITAKSTGKVVKWFVSDEKAISVFPAELKDPFSIVVMFKKKGTFKIIAYTSDENGPSDPAIAIVKIGGGVVPTPPEPDPDPTPGPVDPITKELQDIYNRLTEADKADSLLKLQTLYEKIPLSVDTIKNYGELRSFLTKASSDVLPIAAIKPIRDKLNEYMYKEIPTDPAKTFDKASFVATMNKYHKILKGVK